MLGAALSGPPLRPIEPASGLQHQLAQPDRSGIELRPRRIKHELFVDAGVERRRDRYQRQRFCQGGDQPGRNECHEIGAGVHYDNDYCLVFRLENGKIKEVREYCDSVLTEKALGPFPEAQRRAAG
jgi:ketosteroid isomerase-like protein